MPAHRLAALLLLTACIGQGSSIAAAPETAAAFTSAAVPDSFIVRLATTTGDVDVMVRRDWAPLGADRFYDAVAQGYYDGARFFRSLRGFVTQFGLAADPAVTAQWRDKTIADDSVRQSNRRGSLVFASGGPDTRSTQMFINLRDNARLDGLGFAPIGEVIRGIEAVDALHTGYGDGRGAPQQDSITRRGEAYLAENFPRLDRIVTAKIRQAWMPAPALPPTRPPR